MKVLADSSFLFLPLNLGIDIFRETERVMEAEVEFTIIDPIYKELENIINKSVKPKLKRQVEFTFELLKRCRKINLNRKENESVDDCLVRAAVEMGYTVATADMRLRKKLRDRKISVIYPRGRNYLVLEGFR